MFVRDVPSNAPVLAARDELNFFHQACCVAPEGVSAFEAYCRMTGDSPWPIRVSFWIRDRFSALAGVRPIHGFTGDRPANPPGVGDVLDFFEVRHICEQELFLVADDHHLSVLVAIMLSRGSATERILTVTTSVKIHNLFGRIYMLPVSVAHTPIVRHMLRRVAEPS